MVQYALLILVLGGLVSASATWASVIPYGTRSEWESSVGTFQTEDFESTPIQSARCPEFDMGFGCPYAITIDAPKLDIVIPIGGHAVFDGIFGEGYVNGTHEYRSDLHAGVLIAGIDYNTIVFPDPIVAFAVDLANVFDEDVFCRVQCGPVLFPMRISIAGELFPVASGARFFGATSSTPFTQVVIRSVGFEGGYAVIPSLDDISFAVVPEPGTALLVGVGLAGLTRLRAGRRILR